MSNKVVLVGDKTMGSHGTGFFIKGESGTIYILTNSHVCEISEDGKTIYVQQDNKKPVPKHIIAISDITDLCLVESFNRAPYLKLAATYGILDEVMAFGYPASYGFAPSKGVLLRESVTRTLDFLILNRRDNARCSGAKYEVLNYLGQKLCVLKIRSLDTTLTIIGGNSGSPVVNFWGNVVGIVFAANTEYRWGVIIDQKEIKEFLLYY